MSMHASRLNPSFPRRRESIFLTRQSNMDSRLRGNDVGVRETVTQAA